MRAFLLAVLLTFFILPAPEAYTGAQAVAATASSNSDAIAVRGSQLFRGGRPFMMKGAILVSFVAPRGHTRGVYAAAREHFGEPLLNAAQRWGLNTLRIHIGQRWSDPQGQFYDPAFVAEYKAAVEAARRHGFIVIVSIQDEAPTGELNSVGMATAATLRANRLVGQMFKNDPGVIIELFNEPIMPPTPENWAMWKSGGMKDGTPVVGMESIIQALRKDGVANALIVDGLGFAVHLDGAPPLKDPLNNYAYAVHPFLGGNHSVDRWDRNFGDFAARGNPVVATAWGASLKRKVSKVDGQAYGWCDRAPLDTPQRLMDYLAARKIGVVGWAFDVPGSLVQDYNGTPTTFANHKCGDDDTGPGDLLMKQFQRR